METLLTCRKFQVHREVTTDREGRPHSHEIVVHPGAVVVLALARPDQCILLRQYRTGVGRELWELPAGTLDVPGEAPERAATRELEEEAGYRPGRLDFLCEFYTSPGFLTERIRAYVARDLVPTRQALDPSERIEVEAIPLARAIDMVRTGQIIDAKTIVTLLVHRLRTEEGP